MALSNKQQAFVSEYLTCWNASEAARRAGYNGQANVVGPRLLSNVSIKAEIDQRLEEMKMSADEVLVRLAKMARANIADFAHVDSWADLASLGDSAQVIKRFKRRVYRPKNSDPFEEIEIELYPADMNLERVGKAHGLFNNDAGSSDDKPFIVKVVYGERANGQPQTTAPETD
jgi:phage terminase small subunit